MIQKRTIFFAILCGCFLNIFLALQVARAEPTQQELEQQLQQIQIEIADFEKQLTATTGEKKTLANKIKQLKAQQSQLVLLIKSTALKIKSLDQKILSTESALNKTTRKKQNLTITLGALLRLLNQKDQEILLKSLEAPNGLAGAFIEAQNYAKLSGAVEDLVEQTKRVSKELATTRDLYADEQDDAERLLSLKKAQEGSLLGSISEQNSLLKETQGKEQEYQKLLADSKKRAAEIRSRIYELVGGTKQINFGEAVNLANWVSKQTGIRAPFLLAILTQESNLGKNVGTCNRAGDPPEKNWSVVMKPERDQEPFKQITSELGLNIETTPVSCPLKDKNGKQYGWGGAMGPAQFIPSTWMGYRKKVTAVTGAATANPWDIRDAFVAAAIKLKADGANGTRNGEWAAAMRYFSGSTNTKYRFYGDNVLKLADKYTKDIADLN